MANKKCEVCGQDYKNVNGISVCVEKTRSSWPVKVVIERVEICGSCYRVILQLLNQIRKNHLGQLRIK